MKRIIISIIFLLYISLPDMQAQVRYDLPCRNDLLEKSEEVMLEQVGTIEKNGKNYGEVEKYLAAVNLNAGNPYCAAGMYWCFDQACRLLNIETKNIPIPKTGLVYNIYAHARKAGIKSKYEAERHCLIIWQFPQKRRGHIERITKVGKAGWVETIGFNTSADSHFSQREGEGVFKKRRNLFHILGRMKIKCLVGFTQRGSDV